MRKGFYFYGMKKILIIGTLLMCCNLLKAQSTDTIRTLKTDSTKSIDNDTTVYNYDDIKSNLPEDISFYGSTTAIPVHYPKSAMENDIEGTVIASFIIEKDGTVSHIKIIKKVSRDIDNEVIRVLKLSPRWKPFVLNGQPIRVLKKVSFPFKIN
jgi:periplasmic protein TonB